ncbi:sorting nexin Mvp1, partial [Aureobasidium melanogenum]
MSLFGESPPPTPSARQNKSSLFDDDDQPAARSTSANSGLFAETNDTDDGQSPWDFPAPKKHNSTRQRGDLIKTLLPPSDVPESYVNFFDVLLSQSTAQGGVTLRQIKSLLSESSIGHPEQSKILEIISAADADDSRVLGRGEVNVILALIGLAQEGEELGLDAVDERRRQLPIPHLPSLTAPPKQEQKPPRTPTGPQADSGATQSQSMETPGFGFGDDPWGSPSLHKNHNHESAAPASYAQAAAPSYPNGSVNGRAEPPHVRTTSNFTTTSAADKTESPTTEPSSFEPSRPTTAESGWGGYSASNDGFNTAPGNEGFGEPQSDNNQISGSVRRPVGVSRSSGATGPEELITVNVLEEKEGMFLFQHRNYEVSSIRRNSRVIRRYSDFVWLLDCLHKKFPFRQLPLLPPKRVAINGKHIAADNLFIEKRRRGLARFANALVRHPVLSQDQLVIMFLTVPTELAVWRKQASISVQEEFTGKPLPPGLEDSLPQNLSDLFDTVRNGVRRSTEVYINMCGMVERLIKRNEGLASEYTRLSMALGTLTECSADTYAIDTNEVELLNGGLNGTAKHLSTNQTLLEDEARAWDLGVLEDLKRQRDALVSMRDMFDRRDRYARDNIPQLERRIAANESKLSAIRARHESQIKPGEAEKVESAIVKDKQSIVDQHARGVFIKECVRDEIVNFQTSQYHVSRMHQEWSQERVKYAELGAENWRSLSEELEAMPLGD